MHKHPHVHTHAHAHTRTVTHTHTITIHQRVMRQPIILACLACPCDPCPVLPLPLCPTLPSPPALCPGTLLPCPPPLQRLCEDILPDPASLTQPFCWSSSLLEQLQHPAISTAAQQQQVHLSRGGGRVGAGCSSSGRWQHIAERPRGQ